MGLSGKKNDYPGQLSGGEQQRVALARAIVNGPDILIADEPTGNLDPENSAEIMSLLKMINAYGTTVLVATHEQQMAEEMGMRVIMLNHGHDISKEKTEENVTRKEEVTENQEQTTQIDSPDASNEPVQIEVPVSAINFNASSVTDDKNQIVTDSETEVDENA